ncbi:hypothetical protein KUTeg_004451 [Tegillarca granosa]|uniref:GH18 domain-containing protein n=1 Tax=Tegillarca granosa TaxID=220873 RepID=A0ABQ9FSV1_TEGGR|nr:hypothetical protein KUTeg_004451 [Tegillarca granosa]
MHFIHICTKGNNCISEFAASEFKRVCYYTNWAQYRSGVGKYLPENIDPNLCTHIIYSFAKLQNDVLKAYEWNDESTSWSKGMYERTIAIKQQNPKLKVLIAVGGWNHENQVPLFSNMVTSDSTLNNFVSDSIQFLRDRGFDGLDLDWEYPSVRPENKARDSDKARFTILCKRLREAFEAEAKATGKPRLLLTAAVAAGESTVNAAYEVAEIAKYLDFINLMAYDLNGPWVKFTGHNSPLFPRDNEKGDQRKLNQDWAVSNWLEKGTPKEKLILGLATYGRSFTLSSSSDNAIGAPAKGAGSAGSFTREKGFLAYYEVCEKLNQGWTSVWNDQQQVPYAYYGDQWVGYDNVKSIEIKSRYIVERGLGGGMVWALDLDDFNGKTCNTGDYPLINAMKNVLIAAEADDNKPQPALPLPITSAPQQPNINDDSTNRKTDTDLAASEFKRVCYYTNWAQYRSGVGKYLPENIDPNLCTHIIYSFAKLENNVLKAYEWNDESTSWSKGMYERAIAIKQQNPKLKVLIAVGGWNHENQVPLFSNMVTLDSTLNNFVSDSIQFLRDRGFDGLDLDWEYPSVRPESKARESDKARLTILCKRLREAFEAEAKATGKPRLLLTAAVAAGEIAEIAKYLDFINLMAYDLNGPWVKFTGHNSPLFPRDNEKGDQRKLNQDWAVNNWLEKGAPKEKLILGLATYGRSFTLSSSSDNAIGAPAKGAGSAGSFTREKGFLAYYEVCEKLNQGWTSVWNDQQQVPYAYNGDQWVGYDNVKSIEIKSRYIVERGLGGGMIWALDLDDFNGKTCNTGDYPLINAMKNVLIAAEADGNEPQPALPLPVTSAPQQPNINDDSTNGNTDTVSGEATSDLKLVCYYTFWAKYRKGASFVQGNIDPELCTHIMYAFGQIKGTSIVPYNEDPDLEDAFGFDGLDLDWEYPAFKPSWKRNDNQRFSVLCEILRNAFNEEARASKRDLLLLTAAVGTS